MRFSFFCGQKIRNLKNLVDLTAFHEHTAKAPEMIKKKNGRNKMIRFCPPCFIWFVTSRERVRGGFHRVCLSRSWLVIVKLHTCCFLSQRMSRPSARWQDFNWLITRKLTIRTSANTQNEQSPNCDARTHTHTLLVSFVRKRELFVGFVWQKQQSLFFM